MVTALAREVYEVDTKIVDVEDPPRPTARSRVPTKDLAVHVQLDDGWHRTDESGFKTSCGIEIDTRRQLGQRMGRLIEHPLSENCDCWTKHERSQADENYRKKWGREYVPWTRARSTP